MTSDLTQIPFFFLDWSMLHVEHVTRNNRKNPEYHIVAAVRQTRADKKCPTEKSCPKNMLKMNSISDLKRPTAPKILDSLNTMLLRTANETAAGFSSNARVIKRKRGNS